MPARAGQTWVSTRFHLHLLAAAAGASGVAVAGRTDYYPIKHESLRDAGSRWQLSTTAVLPQQPPTDGGFTEAAAAQLRTDKLALAAALYPPAPTRIHRATKAIRELSRAARRIVAALVHVGDAVAVRVEGLRGVDAAVGGVATQQHRGGQQRREQAPAQHAELGLIPSGVP